MSEDHNWFKPGDEGYSIKFECCRKCGIVRRADGKNKPCRGLVKVALRGRTAWLDLAASGGIFGADRPHSEPRTATWYDTNDPDSLDERGPHD